MPYLAFASAAHCFSCGVKAGATPEVLLAEPLAADCDAAGLGAGAGGAGGRVPGGAGRVPPGRDGRQHVMPRAGRGTVVDHVHGDLGRGQRRQGRLGGRLRRGREAAPGGGTARAGGAAPGGTGSLGDAGPWRGRKRLLHDPLDRGDINVAYVADTRNVRTPGGRQRREVDVRRGQAAELAAELDQVPVPGELHVFFGTAQQRVQLADVGQDAAGLQVVQHVKDQPGCAVRSLLICCAMA